MWLEPDEADDDPGINLAPMIDVVFLLLIFFLTATRFGRDEVDLDLRLPEARSGREAERGQPLVVQVYADGHMTLDGRALTLEALRQKLLAAAARDAGQAVLVRGDKLAPFGLGLQVLDACRLARLGKVDFAALPERN